MKIFKRVLLALFALALLSFLLLFLKLRKEDQPPAELHELLLSAGLNKPQQWQLGDFVVDWSHQGARPQLRVTHREGADRTLWSTVPGKAWVGAARADANVHETRGSFFVHDQIHDRCRKQTLKSITLHKQTLSFTGTLTCLAHKKPIPYSFHFHALTSRQLQFSVHIQQSPAFNRAYLTYRSKKKEHFFGFGEQFTYFDLKGKYVPILVREQGVGRGAQPITWGADLLANSGGSWHTSYASVPHYITSTMRSLFLENAEYATFDLRAVDFVQIGLFAPKMTGRILYGETPIELIKTYTSYSGRMRALPNWVHKGAIIGMQGGTAKVRKHLKQLQKHGAPIAAFWLQDWVGQRTTSFGKQLWWSWTLDRKHYPEWEQLVGEIKAAGAKVMLYINPFLVDVAKRSPAPKRNLYQEAKELGLLVKTATGTTYLLKNTSFSAALLDLTNPKANAWIQKVIHKEMLAIGASGWMADFGEALPFDAILHNKQPAAKVHNRYPELWAKANRDAIRSYDATTPNTSTQAVYFMRAGYTRSPGLSTLFWLGDQLVSWDHHDGIKTAVTGLLSGGISGYSLNHSDIGGYTTINNPLKNYHRSQELHQRWAELSAFTTIYRTHEGNRPGKNHQFHSSPETLKHFVRFAKVYKAWAPYRKRLVHEASTMGTPVVRHPFLHYPDDPRFYRMHNAQMMVGPELMVVPVLDPGKRSVKVYLPPGQWRHLWSGRLFGAHNQSMNFTIDAPIGQPAVFFQHKSPAGIRFYNALKAQGLLAPRK